VKIGLDKAPKDARGYYEAMHAYYYDQQGVMYDEPSTHAGIYREWGYSMIFAGNTTFQQLPTKLTQTLAVGKQYILDLTGHSVYVTMKKAMAPGDALGDTEPIASYFDFNSDGDNFNTGEWKQNVENIYEK
jgi:hypothetical protein